ncbi:MAG: fluoride efflux transporter FluC [Candidatus Nanopelagicaceae bacterium]
MNVLLFSIGAALGAPLRFWVDNKFRPKYKFPIGIFIVNIAGSFLIGLFATHMNYFVVGFCGALTTWSTFIVDLFLEAQNRAYKSSLINLFASLILGVFAFKFGQSLS